MRRLLMLLFYVPVLAQVLTISPAGNGSGGGGTPGGTNRQIQYNNNGVFGGVADPAIINGVPAILTMTPSAGATTVPVLTYAGVSARVVTATDTAVGTDRSLCLHLNSTSAFTETLPTPGSGNFINNFSGCLKNINSGAITFTPASGTVDGQASISVQLGQHGVYYSADNTNYTTRIAGNSHQISAITNFGTALAAQTVVALVPAIGPLGEVQNLSSVVVQSTLGVGCGAGSNTVNVTWAYTAPGGTSKTVAGDTISISANGALDTVGTGSMVSVAAKLGTAITYTTTSALASAGCTTTPQYTVYAKVVN